MDEDQKKLARLREYHRAIFNMRGKWGAKDCTECCCGVVQVMGLGDRVVAKCTSCGYVHEEKTV